MSCLSGNTYDPKASSALYFCFVIESWIFLIKRPHQCLTCSNITCSHYKKILLDLQEGGMIMWDLCVHVQGQLVSSVRSTAVRLAQQMLQSPILQQTRWILALSRHFPKSLPLALNHRHNCSCFVLVGLATKVEELQSQDYQSSSSRTQAQAHQKSLQGMQTQFVWAAEWKVWRKESRLAFVPKCGKNNGLWGKIVLIKY